MLELYIETDHGDGGCGIESLKVMTDVRLMPDNLPNLQEADLKKRFIDTQSWAMTMLEDEYINDFCYEEKEYEEYKRSYGPPDDDEERLSICFWCQHDESEFQRVTFKDLQAELARVVGENFYEEIIQHKGEEKSITFTYTLNPDIFG